MRLNGCVQSPVKNSSGIWRHNINTARDESLEEVRAEGKAEGLEEGRAKGKAEIARRMLALGVSLDIIAKSTDLSVEDVEKLKS
jgi:predicted transposase/invertase (TIGR01784 family)